MDNSPGDVKPEHDDDDNSSTDSEEPTPGPSRDSKQTDCNAHVKFHPYRKPDKSKPPNDDNNEKADYMQFLNDIEEPDEGSGDTEAESDVASAVNNAEHVPSTSGILQTDNNLAVNSSNRLSSLLKSDGDSDESCSSVDAFSEISYSTRTSSSSSNSSSPEKSYSKCQDEVPDFLLIPKPKHTWSAILEIRRRELGYSSQSNGFKAFQNKMYGSLHSVQRLELMYKLEEHDGCVNGLNFNGSGNLLATCSDDLHVCVWDWAAAKLKTKLKTKHKSNIFQSKFLPLNDSLQLVTCGRDGAVCLLSLDSSGSVRESRCLGLHSRAAHKISLVAGSPHCFMSCAEDGTVRHFDVRQKESSKVLELIHDGKLIELFSINCHPTDQHEFMLGGRDAYLRLYDRRNILKPLYKLTPSHLESDKVNYRSYITTSVYNYDGTQFLASYRDDDIYLWDRKDMSNTDVVHKYQGHRNNATIKGVNFFGPRSEFVVSGSDCGNIYFWDRECEAIVMWMAGDENGIVNCLETHPVVPVLATSGLDSDTKIWIPSSQEEPVFSGLTKTVNSNIRQRRRQRTDRGISRPMNARMLWLLWQHLYPASPYVESEYLGEYVSSYNDREDTDDEGI